MSSIVHFEIHFDEAERARKFYTELFGWKVEKLGGKVLVSKMAVPKMGYFALCMDTEGNVFGLWEDDPQANQ